MEIEGRNLSAWVDIGGRIAYSTSNMGSHRPNLTRLDGHTMELVMRHHPVDLLHLRQTATSLRASVDAAEPVWKNLEQQLAEKLKWRKLKRGQPGKRPWLKHLRQR